MLSFVNPDLHIHSCFSDGTDEPEELIGKAAAAGLDLFALTDHDCFEGCQRVRAALRPGDPEFIGGIELSCEDANGKYHMLGYCYDLDKPSLRDAVALTHSARLEKAENRMRYLESLGYTFSEGEVQELLAQKNPGKPHFAQLLMQHGYAAEKAEAFRIISGYRGREFRLTPEMAIDAILQSDGIPVLAHGILGSGSQSLTREEISARVSRLKKAGLMGLECYYSRYTPEQQEIMLELAEREHLMVTAGSDYHGKNKPVALGQTNQPDPKKMQRFYKAVELLGIR